MEFYMEPVIKMFDHLKIKILKAGSKRTAQSCQIIIKNVSLTHYINFNQQLLIKPKKKVLFHFFGTPSTFHIRAEL